MNSALTEGTPYTEEYLFFVHLTETEDSYVESFICVWNEPSLADSYLTRRDCNFTQSTPRANTAKQANL